MNTFYKYILFSIIVLAFANPLKAQESATKTIEKSYPLTNDGTFYLNNRYGDIIINGWDKSTLQITISVKVNHKKKEQAELLLDRFQLEEKAVGNMVNITTEILKKNGSVVSRYFNKANPIDFNKSNVQIDYTISIPKNASIDLTNKFGDIIIESFEGKLNTNLQHGDMWINQDIDNAKIDMKYGKLKTKSIQYGDITLKNADLNLTSSKNLVLNSSGANIEIDEITSLELLSNKDEIKATHIGDIRGDSKFSTIRIGSLADEIDLTMKVTTFNVSKIEKPEAFIHIEQESSDIEIDITGLSFKFKAYLKEGVLKIPKTFENITTDVIDKGDKLREINATYGDNPLGKISVNGYKGTIIFKDAVFSESH